MSFDSGGYSVSGAARLENVFKKEYWRRRGQCFMVFRMCSLKRLDVADKEFDKSEKGDAGVGFFSPATFPHSILNGAAFF